MTRRIRPCLLAVAAIILTQTGMPARGDAIYTVRDLGALPGDRGAAVFGINNSGQVLVASGVDSGPGGSYVDNGGSRTLLPASLGFAYGFNNSGQFASPSSSPALSGNLAINDLGQVAGTGANGDLALQTQSGVTDLGSLGGKPGLNGVNAINNSGQIVGFGIGSDGRNHPFLFSGGHFTELGIAGGAAYGINDKGSVVGGSGAESVNPFLYQNGKLTDLGSLAGRGGLAHSINNLGQIVGWSVINQAGDHHAFLYQNGSMVDLNNLIPKGGFTLFSAQGINDQGSIIVDAVDATSIHALLLTRAVPEPSSYLILAGSSVALLLSRRRRRARDIVV